MSKEFESSSKNPFCDWLKNEFKSKFNEIMENEESLKIKGLKPYLHSLGYEESDLKYNSPVEVQIGTKKQTVFSDVQISVSGSVQIVIDTKHPKKTVTERDILQSASYAKLVSTPSAIYGITTNGIDTFCTNIFTGQQINSIPTKAQLKRDVDRTVKHVFSEVQLREVKSALITLLNHDDLFGIIRKCKEIIEKKGLIRSDNSFREMTKILLVKMAEERRVITMDQQNRFTSEWLTAIARANKTSELEIFKSLFDDAKKTYPEIYTNNDDTLFITNINCIVDVVKSLEDYSFLGTGEDIKGAVYEIFLKNTLRGDLDQYFTPRELTEFITKFADPKLGSIILDLAAGSGGFLIQAFQHQKRKIDHLAEPDIDRRRKFDELIGKCLWAQEADYDLHVLAKMNLIMHGDGWNHVYQGDSLKSKYLLNNHYDFILTNPPFTIKYDDQDVLSLFDLGIGKAKEELDILFVEKSIRCLKEGGELFIVLPEGMVNTKSYQYFREWLAEHTHLLMSVSIPEGAFIPVGKSVSKTCIIGVRKKYEGSEKKNKPKHVFVGKAAKIGYECGKKDYKPIGENDLAFFLSQSKESFDEIRKTECGGECAWVSVDDITSARFDAGFYLNIARRNEWIKVGRKLVPLAEICKVKNNQITIKHDETIYNYLEIDSISETTGTFTNLRKRLGSEIGNTMNQFKGGDILLSRINPRLARAVLIPSSITNGVVSGEGRVLELIKNPYIEDSAVLCALLQTDNVRWQLVHVANGSSSSRARVDDIAMLNEIYVEIPEKNDQKQIADSLRNIVDGLWNASQNFLNEYQSIQEKLGSSFSKDDTKRV